MKSLQGRMLAAVGLVIVFAWALSIAMLLSYLDSGNPTRWQVGLDDFGNRMIQALPARLTPATTPTKVAPDARTAADTSGRGPASLLTAIVLNTAELALVGLLAWWALMAAFRPMRAMSKDIARRNPYDTAPLSTQHVPAELRPLIDAFNGLLARVDTAMRAERQFIADAAHELRTPLAALHVQAEVALAASSMPARDDALGKLIEVSHRTHRLAEQLLDLARLDAGLHANAMAPADLLHLARHVTSEFSIQADDRGMTIHLAGESVEVACDVDEIGILLRNLVDNALRHGRPGGRVDVWCGWVHRAGRRCPMIEVTDDGPGVPKAELAAIFERFYRVTGTTTEGSGIGLSLVSGIAALHGAAVEACRATAEGGLQVRIVFPA